MNNDNDRPKTDIPYDAALHGMQTGVAYEMAHDSKATTPKHLRVGINSAMINDAALVRLLVAKGIITREEYAEEVRLEACREVDRYEARIAEAIGRPITLR